MSLRVRIALISAVAVAIAIAIAALLTFNAAKSELIAEVDASLYDRLELFEQIDGLELQNLSELAEAFGFGRRGGPFARGEIGFDAIYIQYQPVGVPAAYTSYSGGLPVGSAEEAVYSGDAELSLRTVRVEGDNLRMLTAAIPTGTVQVARSLAEVDNSLEGLGTVLRMTAVVGVLLAAGVGYLVSRGAARPIGQLAEAAEHVAETQELEAHIDVNRADEVGRLAQSFNKMLAALQSSRDQQERLVRDAGHELRTPLTAIRTNVELLDRADQIPADERTRMIEDINNEIQELSGLVTELVELAAEPRQGDTIQEQLDLGDLVESVSDKYRRRTGRTINVTADGASVIGNASELERAVGNLLDNAAKWSPDGAPIDVSVAAGRVTVSDRGPGIDEADRPHVFERFYRATRDRSTPGSGLGLSIVAKVAADHGGAPFVEESNEGAVVGFEIPTTTPGEEDESGD